MHILLFHLLIGQLVVGDVSELVGHFGCVGYTWKQPINIVFTLTSAGTNRSA